MASLLRGPFGDSLHCASSPAMAGLAGFVAFVDVAVDDDNSVEQYPQTGQIRYIGD